MDLKDNRSGRPKEAWLKRFFSLAGRGLNEYGMIRDGDSVLIGVSGGKDSLALAYALSSRLGWIRDRYSLSAAMIEWSEYPVSSVERSSLEVFFSSLAIPFSIVTSSMLEGQPADSFNCYICSRRKKKLLFNEARRSGCRTVALGHHLDDLVETALINLSLHGTFATMAPVREYFDGTIRLIRPLALVPESMIRRISGELRFPVVPGRCPFKDTNLRTPVKNLVSELAKFNRNARQNIYRAVRSVRTDP